VKKERKLTHESHVNSTPLTTCWSPYFFELALVLLLLLLLNPVGKQSKNRRKGAKLGQSCENINLLDWEESMDLKTCLWVREKECRICTGIFIRFFLCIRDISPERWYLKRVSSDREDGNEKSNAPVWGT